MKGISAIGIIIAVMVTLSCSATYTAYRSDIFEGKKLLDRGEYGEARALFIKASGEEKRAAAFAYAATASYKMNDLKAAEGYIGDAERAEGRTYFYLRISGYKALTLLKEDKRDEGMAALRDYIDYYRHVYPLTSIEKVEDMWKKGAVNMAALEKILDEQITTYERDVAQAVSTGTGYYARPTFLRGD